MIEIWKVSLVRVRRIPCQSSRARPYVPDAESLCQSSVPPTHPCHTIAGDVGRRAHATVERSDQLEERVVHLSRLPLDTISQAGIHPSLVVRTFCLHPGRRPTVLLYAR